MRLFVLHRIRYDERSERIFGKRIYSDLLPQLRGLHEKGKLIYDELLKRLRDAAKMSEALAVLLPHSEGNATAKLYNEAADAIEELSKLRWIPVNERLPEHGWHLAYGPTIKMEVLHFHCVEEVWSSERYYNIEVTHWMPLPEPPKEE